MNERRFHLVQRRRSIICYGEMCVDDSRIGIGQIGFNLETTRFIAVETDHVADIVFVQECNALCVDGLRRVAWWRNVVWGGRTVNGIGTGICTYGFPAVETDLFGLACDVLGDDIAFCAGFGIGGGEHVYCFGIILESRENVAGEEGKEIKALIIKQVQSQYLSRSFLKIFKKDIVEQRTLILITMS
ncbi:hypothetical protein BPAE_0102g00200 [Botrytis paeoniae]|uniref:Uncharacterized protein n=1 Tax=Botrytis paeoniae TaxID=278948 RepID=A0A4Z1FM07_9HELO|nr:hypothetical protein BPAE_0102g00200 [Botrytis paeoniae]